MSTCPGCHLPIEDLAAIRTYHAGCDPRGRVEMLERHVSNLLRDLENMLSPKMGGMISFQEIAETMEAARAALEYRPAGMKEREDEQR